MKNWLLIAGFIITTGICTGQTGFPFYYEYVKFATAADSLYKSGKYYQSALYYSKAISVKVEKGIPISYVDLHYNAACSWSMAGYADSSFSHLNSSVRLGYNDLYHLLNDADLVSLHPDSRWEKIIYGIKFNLETSEKIKRIYDERTWFDQSKKEIIFMPPDDRVKQLIFSDTLPFISVNYENTRLYFKGKSYAADHLPELKEQLSSAFKQVLSVLNTSFYNKGINLVFADSREELKEITGIAAYGGFAMVGKSTVFLVFNGKRRLQAKHELFHIISQDIWGTTSSRLLDEGGGVFADNECYCENPIYGISAYLLKNDLLLPFNALIENFDQMAYKSDVIAYLESAGIFKYLYEKYGIQKLKQLRLKGFDQFENIYGFSVIQLENEWRSMISTVPVPTEIDWAKLLKQGCG
jgi:hypothetical protein